MDADEELQLSLRLEPRMDADEQGWNGGLRGRVVCLLHPKTLATADQDARVMPRSTFFMGPKMDQFEQDIRRQIAELETRKRALNAALRAYKEATEHDTDSPTSNGSGGGSGSRPKELGIPFLTKKILRESGGRLPFGDLIAKIQQQKPKSPATSIRSGIHREAGPDRKTVVIEGDFVRLKE